MKSQTTALSLLAQAATKGTQTGQLKQQIFILSEFWRQKSDIKVWAGLVSAETSFWGVSGHLPTVSSHGCPSVCTGVHRVYLLDSEEVCVHVQGGG